MVLDIKEKKFFFFHTLGLPRVSSPCAETQLGIYISSSVNGGFKA